MNTKFLFNTFVAIAFFTGAAIADVGTTTDAALESTHQQSITEDIAKRGPLGTVDFGPFRRRQEALAKEALTESDLLTKARGPLQDVDVTSQFGRNRKQVRAKLTNSWMLNLLLATPNRKFCPPVSLVLLATAVVVAVVFFHDHAINRFLMWLGKASCPKKQTKLK